MTSPADRVVIVVFDGLRPDMIAGRMPVLDAFGQGGIIFTGARSVFPSVTRVATSAIGSGHWPQGHGIVGNAFHQPDVLRGAAIDTSDFEHLAAARATWGRVIGPQTLGEVLAAHGLRMAIVHSGSAGSAYVLNPEVTANAGHWTFSIHGREHTQTPDAVEQAIATHGPLPTGGTPKHGQITYATEAALAQALGTDGPDVVVIWFCEPDSSYHYHGIGSPEATAALATADAAFGRIVEAATSGPRGARTAVMALSDHGQVTITGQFGLEAALRADGFDARVKPEDSTRIALTLGASGEARCLHDEAEAPDLAAWLMAQNEIGMVFARDDLIGSIPGALPLSLVRADHARAPALIYVMRSDDRPDSFGLPGQGLMTGSGVPVGGGMHGGLNRHELATVCRLSLPSGPAGITNDRPCALPDVAPTVLALLGLPSPGMAGQALPFDGSAAPWVETDQIIAGHGAFHQTLHRRARGGDWVLDHGGRI
ncbi:MAG: alkaline phosphatase family protein [Pseudorhodobacter sp.]|nr:alkaline phosphatase family protein [Pseudorhodobacter sp.]